ncbi:hypothetical protein AKJ64_01215 [candidate division MSBL1 archaeon SCGC-AAA259E17]|uniref:Uncharacterized protein n=1 Tax=candidate division MSBL1 archaeon SCGC-AAA259E17 TaxID=1698263 RepID=A0A133UGL5_9EURY|nr:hypothetical protein AKJ64_01215 [candidate division MSBL1 archaeon SCGC-AAA259E17]
MTSRNRETFEFTNLEELKKVSKNKFAKEYSQEDWIHFARGGIFLTKEGMQLHLRAIERRERSEKSLEETILIAESYILIGAGIEHLLKACILFDEETDIEINENEGRTKNLGKLIGEIERGNMKRLSEEIKNGLLVRLEVLKELRNNAVHSLTENIKSHVIRKSNSEILDFIFASYPRMLQTLQFFFSNLFLEFGKIRSEYNPID